MARPSKDTSLEPDANLFALLRSYGWWILLLTVLTVGGSALNLAVPELLSHAIDAYTAGTLVLSSALLSLGLVALGIFIFNNLQSVVAGVCLRAGRARLAPQAGQRHLGAGIRGHRGHDPRQAPD